MQPSRKPSFSPTVDDLMALQNLSLNSSGNRLQSSQNGPYLAASLAFPSRQNGVRSTETPSPHLLEAEMKGDLKSSSPSTLSSKSMHSSTDTLNSSGSTGSSSGLGSQDSVLHKSSASVTASNASLADYLGQLVRDRKAIASLPGVFGHVGRLLDEEINKVRNNLFHLNIDSPEPYFLPEQDPGIKMVTLSEKVTVPVDDHPDFNFVGRILGPRGMTAKQLEKQTQCKIMIRGKGSMRDKAKEMSMTGKAGWEHLGEKLHVLITVEDTPERAKLKLERAVDAVKKLLVPVDEEQDELKKRQLLELAILNGTCQDKNSTPPAMPPRMPAMFPVDQRMQAYNMYMAQRNASMFMSPPMQRSMSAMATSPHSAGNVPSYRPAEMALGQPMYEPDWMAYYQHMPQGAAQYGTGDPMLDSWNGQHMYATR